MAGKCFTFVEDLFTRRSAFDVEVGELEAYKASVTGEPVERLNPWDAAYFAERMQNELCDVSDEELRPYFTVDASMDGFFQLPSSCLMISHVSLVKDWNDGDAEFQFGMTMFVYIKSMRRWLIYRCLLRRLVSP